MKKLFSILLLVTLTGLAGAVQAQYAATPRDQLYGSPDRRYGHLEYFGFYASAMGSWNYTDELAAFTNLTWIHVGSADNPAAAIREMIRRLGQAHDAGVAATLSIEPFLFQNEEGQPRSDVEIESFLIELRAQIEAAGLLDTVAMIYPKDEPFREFVRHRDPPFHEQYITGDVYREVHSDLAQVNGLIKLVFPEKPIGVILSGYDLYHSFFSIPENYDWVGFSCYANLFRGCEKRTFVNMYARLLRFMQPDQKLMAVPETWVRNRHLDRADWPETLLSRFKHHYEIALNEPRFVAFIPFIWSFDADAEVPGLGLNRFSELFDSASHNPGSRLVNYVKFVGRRIKQGAPVFPNIAHDETEDSKHRPRSNVRSEIMGINARGLLSAWAFNNALPHKNLRVQVIVRNAAGAVVHRSPVTRTFIRDAGLKQSAYIGRQFVGNHGYRYRLPAGLLERYTDQVLKVELLTYRDGSPMLPGRMSSVYYAGGTVVSTD